MDDLTPRKIVEQLDKYIIGQHNAKRAVAIALRNRWRRQRLSPELKDEVLPKNIIMIGPTGVGKTEIARRLSRLANAAFVKVEASKFTEVGYVGRDVESMIRDLTEISLSMVKSEHVEKVQERAKGLAEERLLDLLLPQPRIAKGAVPEEEEREKHKETRERLRAQLRDGKLDNRYVDIEVREKIMPFGVVSNVGLEDLEINLKEMLGNFLPEKSKRKKVKVPEALNILLQEEASKLIDIDKVTTKHGPVKTEHILFIAAGAFHMTKPSDLIPELQGRFPIRVELDALGKDEFVRILTEPYNALIKQYTALLFTEEVTLNFTKDAIDEIAGIAAHVNEKTENIGARRLHTVLEKLLEDISFEAPEKKNGKLLVDKKYVNEKLNEIVKDEDLSRYIL